jgi:beta-phosphoglucomutase-like phosphatase (HAD superfamily)
MTERTLLLRPLDVGAVDMLLCDADGTLFDSEEPAFAASTEVTNRLLAALGVDRAYTPDDLRRWALGRNFRSAAPALVAEAGVEIGTDVLERWVVTERVAVTEKLATVLRPTAGVRAALVMLSDQFRLCVVTSSATPRLDRCLGATALDDLFPPDVRFSAEDSLPTPVSKPDPSIYRFAGEQLGVCGARGLAIEDSVAGVRSAVAAGFPAIGMLEFVPRDERTERVVALGDAGVAAIVPSWRHLAELLASGRHGRSLVGQEAVGPS